MSPSFIDKHDLISTFPTRERVVLELAWTGQTDRRITVDMMDIEGTDIVASLDEGLPFSKTNQPMRSTPSIFEHVKDVNLMMREIYRV